MPATCLRQGRRWYRRYPRAYVNVCRRRAADIAGCPGPCRRLTGKVELSSTLPVCRRCFRPLLDDRRWFLSMWMLVGGWRRHPSVNTDMWLLYCTPNSIRFKVTDGSNLRPITTLFLFYKHIFYKNIEAETCEVLKISLRLKLWKEYNFVRWKSAVQRYVLLNCLRLFLSLIKRQSTLQILTKHL